MKNIFAKRKQEGDNPGGCNNSILANTLIICSGSLINTKLRKKTFREERGGGGGGGTYPPPPPSANKIGGGGSYPPPPPLEAPFGGGEVVHGTYPRKSQKSGP